MSRALQTYNQFSQEDLLVRVESVDDQVHQLTDLGLKAESMKQFTHQSRFPSFPATIGLLTYPKVSACPDILLSILLFVWGRGGGIGS
jgi:hypothetical protein